MLPAEESFTPLEAFDSYRLAALLTQMVLAPVAPEFSIALRLTAAPLIGVKAALRLGAVRAAGCSPYMHRPWSILL